MFEVEETVNAPPPDPNEKICASEEVPEFHFATM
jgi:hypothetical protein